MTWGELKILIHKTYGEQVDNYNVIAFNEHGFLVDLDETGVYLDDNLSRDKESLCLAPD